MRVVLDTNVFVSGVFFSGPPRRILEAWRDGKLEPVYSPQILEEYPCVGDRLAERYADVHLGPFLELLITHGTLSVPHAANDAITQDPDDDKFLECALGGEVKVVVSGDQHVLAVSSWNAIEVLKPADFVQRFL